MNLIFVISAPTGVGKSAVCLLLEEKYKDALKRVVTHTTREKRKNEKEDVDYYFVSLNLFKSMIDDGEFIEYASVHDNYYGVSKKAFSKVLNNGYDALLAIDVQGALKVMRQFYNVISIFMLPPSLDEWIRRIKTEDIRNDIELRLRTSLKELDKISNFHYCIINNSLEKTLYEMECIINSSHKRFDFSKANILSFALKLKSDLKNYLRG